MAQAKEAMGHGGPMPGVRPIHVNVDGSIEEGDWVGFTPGSGKIQFVVPAGFPQGVSATFTPAYFGNPQTGVVPISQHNAQNPPLSANNQISSGIASYMITGPNISQGPYCVTVGGASMAVQVDSLGNLTPPQIRIPNSGLLAFNAAAPITFNVTWTGGGDGPFGSPTLVLQQGLNLVHANDVDCTVQLAAGAGANPPGTIKIGSGGSSPLPDGK
jgi:hypothetical protein